MTAIFEATFVHDTIFKKQMHYNNKNMLDHYCQQELSQNNRSNFDNMPAWKTQVAGLNRKLASAENKLNTLNVQIDALASNTRTKEDHEEVLEQREMCTTLADLNDKSNSALKTTQNWIEYKEKCNHNS